MPSTFLVRYAVESDAEAIVDTVNLGIHVDSCIFLMTHPYILLFPGSIRGQLVLQEGAGIREDDSFIRRVGH